MSEALAEEKPATLARTGVKAGLTQNTVRSINKSFQNLGITEPIRLESQLLGLLKTLIRCRFWFMRRRRPPASSHPTQPPPPPHFRGGKAPRSPAQLWHPLGSAPAPGSPLLATGPSKPPEFLRLRGRMFGSEKRPKATRGWVGDTSELLLCYLCRSLEAIAFKMT